MKIVIFEVEDWERERLERGLCDEGDLTLLKGGANRENAAEHSDAEVISPFIYSKLDQTVLNAFSNLKLIATRSTGYDHIDPDYCREHGVTVCNVPSYGENTVAEHVFGLILTIARNLEEEIDRTRRGIFALEGPPGFDLKGKTLGVVGTGHIGRCVIGIGRGFGMEVIAFNRTRYDELASELGFQYVGMDELLSRSDIVTLHVPATKETHHLISEEEFSKMKQGSVLINTSRGAVVDVHALSRALVEGPVVSAGLDVLPEEPVIREEAELLRAVFQEDHDSRELLADHVLMRLRNVVITPHSGFYTREAVNRILDQTVENICSFIRGEPQNIVIGEGE